VSVDNRLNKLVNEEIKSTKLFIWMFYIIFFSFDLFYYCLLPMSIKKEVGLPNGGMGFFIYVFIIGLLPIAIYLIKKGKPEKVKYVYFISYTILEIVNISMIYFGNNKEFANGNVVEIFLILFTAIFISKKYFGIVTIGLILKYALVGFILQEPRTMIPIAIFIPLSGISYLFLSRFHSYFKTLENIYEDLRKKEQLALVGQMATAVGHEIRNPLAALKGLTQLQQERHPNNNEFYPIMINEIERINLIVNDLMYLGKPMPFKAQNHDIKEIIQYVVKMLKSFAFANNVSIDLLLADIPKVYCDGNKLKQVFINLIKNSIESMPDGGAIQISSSITNKDHIVIHITDEGCGIAEDTMEKLGQPFYTTKQDGTGLGLMVTKKIIEQHNGVLKIVSRLGDGTSVEIFLPRGTYKLNEEVGV
jgi:signal transduction histidine kinase